MKRTHLFVLAGMLALIAGWLVHATMHTTEAGGNVVAPWTQAARNLFALAVAVGVFLIILVGLPTIQRLSGPKRRIACFSLLGWAGACLAFALIVSVWHALMLAEGPEGLLTPVQWVLGRAAIVGVSLAIVPGAVSVWLAKRLPDAVS